MNTSPASLPEGRAGLLCSLSGGRLCKYNLTRLTPILKPNADFSPVTLRSSTARGLPSLGTASNFVAELLCGEVFGLGAGETAGFSSPSKNNCSRETLKAETLYYSSQGHSYRWWHNHQQAEIHLCGSHFYRIMREGLCNSWEALNFG